jgi:hypothetical protein
MRTHIFWGVKRAHLVSAKQTMENHHILTNKIGSGSEGSFYHIPIKDTPKLAEVFRRRVIKLFVEKDLLQKIFAMKPISWEHSGFSVDNSVPIPASSGKARVNLSQYIIRL